MPNVGGRAGRERWWQVGHCLRCDVGGGGTQVGERAWEVWDVFVVQPAPGEDESAQFLREMSFGDDGVEEFGVPAVRAYKREEGE